MLKPAEACQVVAHLSGRPVSWTEQTARLMREADLDLWPQIGKGSRSGTVTAQHLANLLIATSTPMAAPVSAAPTVKWFRSLKRAEWACSIEENAGIDTATATLAQIVESAADFGEFMEQIIEALASDMRAGDARSGFSDFLTTIKFEIALQSEADGSLHATVLVAGKSMVVYTDIGGPRTNKDGGGGILWWHRCPQQRARYASFLPWGVLISLAAAYSTGRRELAFLPSAVLNDALAQSQVVAAHAELAR